MLRGLMLLALEKKAMPRHIYSSCHAGIVTVILYATLRNYLLLLRFSYILPVKA